MARQYNVIYTRETIQAIARNILNGACFLDTETNGISNESEIVSIGIIDAHENVLFSSYFKPTQPIPEEVTKVHGITNEMVENSPIFSDVSEVILDIMHKYRPVIIYNEKFDLRLLSQTADKFNVKDFHFNGIKTPGIISQDVMLLISQWFQDDKTKKYCWKKLSDCYNELCPGQEITAHEAVADCRMMVRCLKAIAYGDSRGPGYQQEEDDLF